MSRTVTTGPLIFGENQFIAIEYKKLRVRREYPTAGEAHAAFTALTARFHAAWMAVVAEEIEDGLYEQETGGGGGDGR